MVFREKRPRIRHRLPDIRIRLKKTSEETQPGDQPKRETNLRPSATPDLQALGDFQDFLINVLPALLENVPCQERLKMWFMHDGSPARFLYNQHGSLYISGRQHSLKWVKGKRSNVLCPVVQQEEVESIPTSSYECTIVQCLLRGFEYRKKESEMLNKMMSHFRVNMEVVEVTD
ncbi:hypothetical protein ANN_22400 [Periplaneta americana]|uniref:Uncharacterized protein n=1 Tax=Periplaneta americana TaxID=6978 RepID=A0ABQ8S8P1_PERAM|nr:hypothetical protein ANN_22400 [Periplaneta americana]